MSQTRYCSTCGSLLGEGAAICGECGARYQASPYERRATDAPGAWSPPPTPRSRDLGPEDEGQGEEEAVELISRDSLAPEKPGATTLRTREQYDQVMVTQPPMPQNAPGASAGMPSGPGSPATAAGAPPTDHPLEPPLDGCAPASPLKRVLAALIDSVIAILVLVPLMIGGILAVTTRAEALLPYILIGVGVALPAAYVVLMIWLSGAKGFTVGKLILGLRITRDSQGGPLGVVRALGRWFLYGVFPLLMALSIFLDPKKHLRGFHDRAIDSVVVDVQAGRNPLQPRPDDFERESAEHYLGSPSVPVSAHENLLAEPGAAWQDSAAPEPSQPAPSGAWGEAASPYAPPAPGTSAPSAADAPPAGPSWASAPEFAAPETAAPAQSVDGGWAPPSTEPVPPQQSWGTPDERPAQSWGPQTASAEGVPSWDQPASPQDIPSWDQPAAPPAPQAHQPQQSHPSQQPQQPWSPPRSAPAAPASEATQGWAPPAVSAQDPAPAAAPYGQAPDHPTEPPSDLTGDAWAGEDPGVDEQTRLTVPDEPLGDLEATRLSPVQLPPVRTLRLTTDDGAERAVEKAVVVGRNPAASADEVLFVMKDDTRSVSKTHLRIDGSGDEVLVTDLGSTNGSTLLREDGARENLVPNAPTVLPAGAQVTLGDRTLTVERVQ